MTLDIRRCRIESRDRIRDARRFFDSVKLILFESLKKVERLHRSDDK